MSGQQTAERAVEKSTGLQEYTAVVERIVFRKPTLPNEPPDPFCIAKTADGKSVKGTAPHNNFEEGMTYRFFGTWEAAHSKYGQTFRFTSYAQAEPISRLGLVKYLAKNCPGVGPAIASLMFEKFGAGAARVLREDPDMVHRNIPRLSLEDARAAAEVLKSKAKFEDTRIALMNLLDGLGFPGAIYDALLNDRKYGAAAADRIRRDPFCLMVDDLPGAGFNRCDQLYLRLGLDPTKLKRQMFCLWNHMSEDRGGNTWFRADSLDRPLREKIGGCAPKLQKTIRLGDRAGWLVSRLVDGVLWVARAEDANAEDELADNVIRLLDGRQVLPLYTVRVPGECDHTEGLVDPPELTENADGNTENTDRNTPDNTEENERNAEENAENTDSIDWLPPEFEGLDNVLVTPRERPTKTDKRRDAIRLARLGRQLGVCQFCGRELVNPESRTLGYGPVCAERYGLPWGHATNPPATSSPATSSPAASSPAANPPSQTPASPPVVPDTSGQPQNVAVEFFSACGFEERDGKPVIPFEETAEPFDWASEV